MVWEGGEGVSFYEPRGGNGEKGGGKDEGGVRKMGQVGVVVLKSAGGTRDREVPSAARHRLIIRLLPMIRVMFGLLLAYMPRLTTRLSSNHRAR